MQAIFDSICAPINADIRDLTVTLDANNQDFSQGTTLQNRAYVDRNTIVLGHERICTRGRRPQDRARVHSVEQVTVRFHNVFFRWTNITPATALIRDILDRDGLVISVDCDYDSDPNPHMVVVFEPVEEDQFFGLLLDHLLENRVFRRQLEAFVIGIQLASDNLFKINSRAYRNNQGSRPLPAHPTNLLGYVEWVDYLFVNLPIGPQRGTLTGDTELGRFYRRHPEIAHSRELLEDLRTELSNLTTDD